MKRSLAVAAILAAALRSAPLMATPGLDVRPLDPDWKGIGEASAGTPELEGRSCGTEDPPAAALRAIEREIAPYRKRAEIEMTKRPGKTRTIQVAFLIL